MFLASNSINGSHIEEFFYIYLYCILIMEDTNTIQKQIQVSLEAVHNQIAIPDSDLESKDSVKRIIVKYQNRVSEMLKLIQKQKKQNEILKAEFKQLNQQLNTVLRKVDAKGRSQSDQKPVDAQIDLLKRELQNQIKKNSNLKKLVQTLKSKLINLSGQTVDDLKNELKQKQRQINQLNGKIKLFQKLDKQQKSGDSYKKQKQLNQKIMQLNEEIIHLKKKFQESKKNQQQLQKTIKYLREQIGSLQLKVSNKRQSQNKVKQKAQQTISQQEYDKLNDKFKQLQTSKKMNDKTSKHQIETLNIKIKTMQRQLQQIKETVNKKQKQQNILMFKLKQKERKNYNTLQPINKIRYSQQILHSSNLFQNRKQYKGLTFGQGIYRQFQDFNQLPIQKNYRIKNIVFTHFQQHILSLKTDYVIMDNQASEKQSKRGVKSIQSFIIGSQYTNIKTVEYKFQDYQYITSIDVYCSKFIEYIKIQTSKQEVIEVGNSRNVTKCKCQSFEIRHHQKPISFMAIIENKKIGAADAKQYLISLGLQIRRKEVFLRSKFNKKSETLYRKSALSKSHNDKNKKEDQ